MESKLKKMHIDLKVFDWFRFYARMGVIKVGCSTYLLPSFPIRFASGQALLEEEPIDPAPEVIQR